MTVLDQRQRVHSAAIPLISLATLLAGMFVLLGTLWTVCLVAFVSLPSRSSWLWARCSRWPPAGTALLATGLARHG